MRCKSLHSKLSLCPLDILLATLGTRYIVYQRVFAWFTKTFCFGEKNSHNIEKNFQEKNSRYKKRILITKKEISLQKKKKKKILTTVKIFSQQKKNFHNEKIIFLTKKKISQQKKNSHNKKKEFSQQEKILIAKRKILTTKKQFSQQNEKKILTEN